MSKPHSVPDIREWQASAWRASAERADSRKEPLRATYFRNLAWQIETGQTWTEYIKTLEDKNGTTVHSVASVPQSHVSADRPADTTPSAGGKQ